MKTSSQILNSPGQQGRWASCIRSAFGRPTAPRACTLIGRAATLALLLAGVTSSIAAVRYVDLNSTNATPPYTNWATAATVIQDAVEAAMAGDEIVVTDGIYATGGRPAGTNALVNRVTVDKPVTVRSVNGPEVTIIRGYQVAGSANRDGAVRCVYLASSAILSGFTLTNGATRTAGDYEREQSGGGVWCESSSALVTNCALVGNSASSEGGGAYNGTLNNCTITGNAACFGGGVGDATLNNCTLSSNQAGLGGAAYEGTLNNCALSGNSADYGGGVCGGTLNNCTLTGNSAYYNDGYGGNGFGGGACESTLRPAQAGLFWTHVGRAARVASARAMAPWGMLVYALGRIHQTQSRSRRDRSDCPRHRRIECRLSATARLSKPAFDDPEYADLGLSS